MCDPPPTPRQLASASAPSDSEHPKARVGMFQQVVPKTIKRAIIPGAQHAHTGSPPPTASGLPQLFDPNHSPIRDFAPSTTSSLSSSTKGIQWADTMPQRPKGSYPLFPDFEDPLLASTSLETGEPERDPPTFIIFGSAGFHPHHQGPFHHPLHAYSSYGARDYVDSKGTRSTFSTVGTFSTVDTVDSHDPQIRCGQCLQLFDTEAERERHWKLGSDQGDVESVISAPDDTNCCKAPRRDIREEAETAPKPSLPSTQENPGLDSPKSMATSLTCNTPGPASGRHLSQTAPLNLEPGEQSESPLSQTTQSEASEAEIESQLAERKASMIDSVVSFVMSRIKLGFAQARGGSEEPPPPAATTEPSKRSEQAGSGLQNSRKRARPAGNGFGADGEDDDADPTGANKKAKSKDAPRFACPYFKYNPIMYKTAQNCPGPGWQDVHRVKEHLYRRHRQPKYRCQRCWQPFRDEAGFVDHQRALEPCPLREIEHVEGFDATQERSLRSRKRAKQDLSEPEKWREVYKVLFPHVEDDNVPSPCKPKKIKIKK
ncbi:hypothetical protein B0H67DRAFT_143264 [Lasiosphaeris hirsuta]|uniref:C2H2-type domain-containing protein n=1 Tax=Lasiosphaeris hirsuta TaxID=260670 RepID=A0AA40B1F9_9PEZI|nr:hypothetical protein B0H67DRAFT_143264 [Lasiosphaeris hirsuta]